MNGTEIERSAACIPFNFEQNVALSRFFDRIFATCKHHGK